MTQQPKDIVLSAFSYLSEILPSTQKISDVRIEEIQPNTPDATHWKVVLSYDALGSFAFDKTREFKEFKVSDTDKKVIWMKSVNAK